MIEAILVDMEKDEAAALLKALGNLHHFLQEYK